MTFEFRPAVREDVPLLIGVAGGTGSGKTMSALRIARGLAGDRPFAVLDTESGRAKAYADDFQPWHHAELHPPFRPEAYAEAIAAADTAGYPVIVVDSMTHEWDGDGGCLEWQEEEYQRLGGRDAVKLLSWQVPKKGHRKMLTRLLQVRAHVILCFRAAERVEMGKDAQGKTIVRPKQTLTGLGGWVPICEPRLPYELTLSVLLTADEPGLPKPIKLMERHKGLVPLDQPLTEGVGRALGAWAAGGEAPEVPEALALTNAVLELAEQLGSDLDVVAASITRNAAEHEREPDKHVAWLKRQRTTLRKCLDEQGETAEPLFQAPAGVSG